MQGLTIKEASKRMGVSSDTIRRRIRSGELKASLDANHTYRIDPGDLPPATEPTPEPTAQDNAGEVEALKQTIALLQTELEARRREVQELHVLLQQSRPLLPERTSTLKSLWYKLTFRSVPKSSGE